MSNEASDKASSTAISIIPFDGRVPKITGSLAARRSTPSTVAPTITGTVSPKQSDNTTASTDGSKTQSSGGSDGQGVMQYLVEFDKDSATVLNAQVYLDSGWVTDEEGSGSEGEQKGDGDSKAGK
jgi:hypothetical protein